MGFSVTGAAIIVLATLLLTSAVMVVSVLTTGMTLVKGVKQAVLLTSKQKLAFIQVKSAALLNSTALEFVLSNNGSETLWDYERTDVIVSYTPLGSLFESTYKLSYGEGWVIVEIIIQGGYTEPFRNGRGIHPSESARIVALLPRPVDPTRPVTIVVVNQYGGKAFYRFVPG